MERPAWVKDKKIAEDFEVIRHQFNEYKDFRIDKGYVLIRVYNDTHEIGLAVCTDDHTILKEFRGRIAQDVYTGLRVWADKQQESYLLYQEHWAYIGKELKKAEIALSMEYVQE